MRDATTAMVAAKDAATGGTPGPDVAWIRPDTLTPILFNPGICTRSPLWECQPSAEDVFRFSGGSKQHQTSSDATAAEAPEDRVEDLV